MRYDACIIGAGAEGLAAAATLSGRGLKVFVAERDSDIGGRCATREFHPGFRASPFADELPAIPSDIFRALDLARRGAVLAPAPASLALWPGRQNLRLPWAEPSALSGRLEALRRAIIDRAMADADLPPKRGWFAAKQPSAPWPGEELAGNSLADMLGEASADPDERAHLMAMLLNGRVCDPGLAGGALHLLAGAPGGMAAGLPSPKRSSGFAQAGGLGRLGGALRRAAEECGAEISCGLEVADIKRSRGRVTGVGLADGTEIAARAVLSTLDLRRTFLALFSWSELPRAVTDRVAGFRAAPGIARLLLALKSLPDPPPGADPIVLRGPIHVAPDAVGFAEAYRAWSMAAVPERPPAMLRVVSAVDPSLAPPGGASLTVTLGAIPYAPFDGHWTNDKRARLREAGLAAAEAALPGTAERVVGAELIVPPDMEDLLGATCGDLAGGELGADQMLGFRPFAECRGSRTPVEGLYLAGPSSTLGPLATCASGLTAARAVLADMAAGRLG